MAYAALVSVAQMLGEDVLPLHQDYSRLCKKEQMETLQSNVVFLQKLLEQCQGYRSSMVSQLESRITDVAYQVEDIIRSQISGDGEATFSAFRICTQEVNSIVEVAREIKKIVEMKKDVVVGRDSRTTSPSTIGAPGGGDTKQVGLDQDLIQIKERVVGHNPRLEIIPIVGMGGIGKTTLARIVYEDPHTVAHFDFRFWVTVSQEHQAQKILQVILSDVGGASNDVGSLIERVYKTLIGRRFLIVMDDMWSAEAWDSVKNAFPDDGKSSRVILTTRLSEIAVKVDSSSRVHQMQLLNEDQSWSLFRKEAFGQKNGHPELEITGKIIMRNCRGLPLAIVVTAGILKLNHTQDYWETLAISINSAAAAALEDQLFRILSLSYDNLPPHLKACFLYMSMFPEDFEIPSARLIRLWVAEGFLKPKRDKNMEEAAEEYLVDLVERNLIFVSKKKYNGRIKTCTIHDVLRELSLKKAKEENFSQHFMRSYTGNTNSTIVYPRRLSIRTIEDHVFFSHFQHDLTYTPVHSLIFHNMSLAFPMLSVEKFRLLRVLDGLSIYFVTEIMNEVFSLFHLRYLSFRIERYSITTDLMVLIKCKNLETLIVEHVGTTSKFGDPLFMLFPILQLPKLRHFILPGTHPKRCYYGIDELGKSHSVLNSLQTLSGVTNIKFTEVAIKSFENLIKLKVQYTEEWESFCLDNLVLLQQLEKLSLLYDYYIFPPVLLPTNIEFPPKLKKLSMSSCKISWEQMSVIGSLPNLEVLKLVQCQFESSEWEPDDGEFQLLKYLRLEIYNLEEWRVESFHFPCLEQLIIYSCTELKELPISVGEIETLKKLVIQRCEECIGDSARKIQEEQESYGNTELEVVVKESFRTNRKLPTNVILA